MLEDNGALRAPDGGPTRILADRGGLGGIAQWLAWGRDGSTVYASVRRPAGQALMAIAVADGRSRVIVADDPAHHISNPRFATDGHRLFFTLAAWESDVWVMDLKR